MRPEQLTSLHPPRSNGTHAQIYIFLGVIVILNKDILDINVNEGSKAVAGGDIFS